MTTNTCDEKRMTDTKVDYDSNSDLLYVYREGTEIKREVDVGDMVIQLDSDGKVVGFEMLNASDFLILRNGSVDSKEFLRQVKDAEMNISRTENALQITTYLSSDAEGDGMVTSQAPAMAA